MVSSKTANIVVTLGFRKLRTGPVPTTVVSTGWTRHPGDHHFLNLTDVHHVIAEADELLNLVAHTY